MTDLIARMEALREWLLFERADAIGSNEAEDVVNIDAHIAALTEAITALRALEASERQVVGELYTNTGSWLTWQAFLEWNRALPNPVVEIGAEYSVAQTVISMHSAATPPAAEAIAGQSGFVTVPRKCTPIIKEWMLQAESGEWNSEEAWQILIERLAAAPTEPAQGGRGRK